MKVSDFKINSLVALKAQPDVLIGHVTGYIRLKNNEIAISVQSVDRDWNSNSDKWRVPLEITLLPELLTLYEC